MAFLLDTNVISETVKPKPEPNVIAWFGLQSASEMFLAAQTIGELMRGARKVKEQARRDNLERWIAEELTRQFEGRILPFDGDAAVLWGRLIGDCDRRGRPVSAADAQIAAIALQHGLSVVTRNVKDFERLEVDLINPWKPAAAG